MVNTYKIFETERLLLRPTNGDDAAFILELLNTPKWLHFIGDRNVKSLEDARDYINNKILPQFRQQGYGNYTVTRKSDGLKVGSCGLYNREGVDGVDIGFGFLPAYEKKGYGFESALKIKDMGINYFKLKQISAITNKENKASRDLLTKLGLQYVKVIQLPDSDEKLMLYRLINNKED